MKNIFKNRLFLGSVCLLVAALLAFVIAPKVEQAQQVEVTAYVMNTSVEKGTYLTEETIKQVQIPEQYVPASAITEPQDIIGKVATVNLMADEYLFAEKLSDTMQANGSVFETVDKDTVAVSVTLKTFASGMSAALQPEDIVSVVSDTSEETSLPQALQYVRVLAVTTANAQAYDAQSELEEQSLPATITLSVTPEQAVLLADLELNANMHFVLVSRGDAEMASVLLSEQQSICETLATPEDAPQEEILAEAPTA